MISNLQEKGMGQQQRNAFITTRKGFCCLSIKGSSSLLVQA